MMTVIHIFKNLLDPPDGGLDVFFSSDSTLTKSRHDQLRSR
jgi:hypothetical protein